MYGCPASLIAHLPICPKCAIGKMQGSLRCVLCKIAAICTDMVLALALKNSCQAAVWRNGRLCMAGIWHGPCMRPHLDWHEALTAFCVKTSQARLCQNQITAMMHRINLAYLAYSAKFCTCLRCRCRSLWLTVNWFFTPRTHRYSSGCVVKNDAGRKDFISDYLGVASLIP